MKKLIALLLLTTLLTLNGCATTGKSNLVVAQQTAQQAALVSGSFFKATPPIVDALFAAGKITKDQYNQIAQGYNQSLAAYQLYVAAVDVAIASGTDPASNTSVVNSLAAFTTSQNNLTNLMTALGVPTTTTTTKTTVPTEVKK